MRIRILAVGSVREPGYALAQKEYAKRLQKYARLEIVEVDNEPVPGARRVPGGRGDRDRAAVRLREGERLQQRARAGVPAPGTRVAGGGRAPTRPGTAQDSVLVALDARGSQFTSEEFAAWLGRQLAGKAEIVFVLGGALGLSPILIERADLRLSLSTFTLPHQLARVVLLEQLYRAFRILRREPYHY